MGEEKMKTRIDNVGKFYPEVTGKYDMPVIHPTEVQDVSWISFNYAKTSTKKEGKGVHFFLDDYQFLRVWNNPDAYINILSGFDCVMSPDFSTYTEYPLIMQMYNHYRKHWLAAYWQRNGIKVIPTISWGDENTYSWCFDGEPVNSVVAVSSVGTQQNSESKSLFLKGYNEMIERLEPETIYFYGKIPPECKGNIVHIEPFYDSIKTRTNKEK